LNCTGATPEANYDAAWTYKGAGVLGRNWELTKLTDEAEGVTRTIPSRVTSM
jgi:hypothetical protein